MSNASQDAGPSQLWNHILSLPLPRPLTSRTQSSTGLPTLPQLTPSDRTGTTLRLLLQDAQKTMENFSERLDKLFTSLEHSKQTLHRVGTLFEETRDRAAEETRGMVHVAKSEIENKLETLATRELMTESTSNHSTAIRTVHETLESMDKRLDNSFIALNERLGCLDRRFDQLNICSERNSESLSMVKNQLSQLLAALGAVATLSPLLQVFHAIPQHHQDPVSEVSQAITDAQTLVSTQIDANSRLPGKRLATSVTSDDGDVEGTFGTVNKRFKISGVEQRKTPFEGMLTDSGSSVPTSQTQVPFREPTVMEIPSSDVTFIPASSFPNASPALYSSPMKKGGSPSGLNAVSGSVQPSHQTGFTRRSRPVISDRKRQPGRTTRDSAAKSIGIDENTIGKEIKPVRKQPSLSRKKRLSAEVASAESRPQGSTTDAGGYKIQPLTREGTGPEDWSIGSEKIKSLLADSSGEEGVPMQRGPASGETRPGADGLDTFQNLAQMEEDEENVSLDMSFVWGSLPDDDSSSDVLL